MTDPLAGTARAAIARGVWLRVGVSGAGALAASLLQMFDGEPKWLLALTLAVPRLLLAAAPRRRAGRPHAAWQPWT